MRNRRTNPAADGAPLSRPGEFVKEFARRMGWDFGYCNLMLEGTTDVSYLHTANRLHESVTGMRLIDSDFQVFPVGVRELGGTEAIKERLAQLGDILRLDPKDENGRQFRVVAVFDDDAAGRGAFKQLRQKFRQWGDLYLIKRVYPQNTRDPSTFGNLCERMNSQFEPHFCEIEDLLARDLLDLFCSETAGVLKCDPQDLGESHHFDFHGWAKPKLAEFVDDHASIEDVKHLISLLQLFRWLFGLCRDGSSAK